MIYRQKNDVQQSIDIPGMLIFARTQESSIDRSALAHGGAAHSCCSSVLNCASPARSVADSTTVTSSGIKRSFQRGWSETGVYLVRYSGDGDCTMVCLRSMSTPSATVSPCNQKNSHSSIQIVLDDSSQAVLIESLSPDDSLIVNLVAVLLVSARSQVQPAVAKEIERHVPAGGPIRGDQCISGANQSLDLCEHKCEFTINHESAEHRCEWPLPIQCRRNFYCAALKCAQIFKQSKLQTGRAFSSAQLFDHHSPTNT